MLDKQGDSKDEFKAHYESTAPAFRFILMAVAIVLIGSTPLFDTTLLNVPDGFRQFSRWMQFGIQIPTILLALACAWFRPLRRWSAPVLLVATLATAAALCAQHVVGARYGFHVPHEFSVMALAATCLLGRLRQPYFLPWATLTMIAVTSVELVAFDLSAAAIYNVISMWMLFAIAAVAGLTFERYAYDNWQQRMLLQSQASRDWLTGLPNRRHFEESLATLMRLASREKRTISMVALDVDHFKLFNDRYGHPAGDDCLKRIGRWISDSMRRPNDFCGRIGGEEFAAVWYDAKPDVAPALAEQLRAGIAELGIEHKSPTGRNVVTCSAGFAQVIAPESEDSAAEALKSLYDRADRALYQAKRSGRDCMVQSGDLVLARNRFAKAANHAAEPKSDGADTGEQVEGR